MSTRVASLLIFFFALPGVTQAEGLFGGPFVEPAVTYESGNTSINYPSPLSDSTGKSEGLGLGARLGFHLSEIFFMGLDFRYSRPQFTDSSVTYSARAVSTNWGPVVGLQTPIVGLRVWGSYLLGAELDPEKSGSFDVKFQNGTGYRFGAGFRVAMVSLNLEYQQLKYAQSVLEQLGPFSSGSTLDGVNLNNKSWIVSVSLPIEF